ncbi:unnamed protein product [Arctia plantaginis]|uniref:Uncharacterized protein n=1 Tax=Arctia plantaginis TaxID=874455 RepID=A0A8S1B434_ARCPL|nr:unnamed protein product [Arctia plantaginis]
MSTYSAHNEGIQSCRSIAVPIIISSIITLTITGVLIAAILVLDRKFNMFHRFINSICTRKEIKKDKRINELTEIIQKRIAMKKAKQPGQNSLYQNLDDPSPPGRRKLFGKKSPAISLIGLAIANSLGSAKACDDLMFLNSNG